MTNFQPTRSEPSRHRELDLIDLIVFFWRIRLPMLVGLLVGSGLALAAYSVLLTNHESYSTRVLFIAQDFQSPDESPTPLDKVVEYFRSSEGQAAAAQGFDSLPSGSAPDTAKAIIKDGLARAEVVGGGSRIQIPLTGADTLQLQQTVEALKPVIIYVIANRNNNQVRSFFKVQQQIYSAKKSLADSQFKILKIVQEAHTPSNALVSTILTSVVQQEGERVNAQKVLLLLAALPASELKEQLSNGLLQQTSKLDLLQLQLSRMASEINPAQLVEWKNLESEAVAAPVKEVVTHSIWDKKAIKFLLAGGFLGLILSFFGSATVLFYRNNRKKIQSILAEITEASHQKAH